MKYSESAYPTASQEMRGEREERNFENIEKGPP